MTRISRPLFQGVLHLIAATFYLSISPWLLSLAPPDLTIPVMIYLITVVGHFAVSASLHLPNWSDDLVVYPRASCACSGIRFVQALDHIMIFSKLAASYYVAICTVMFDADPIVTQVLTIGITLGILLRIVWTQAPNVIIGLPYVIVGWAPILDLEGLSRVGYRVGNGSYLAIIAGLAYTIGAMMYITRRPRPCDKYMGYHELFHVCTIIGAILFSICLFGYVIPYHEIRTAKLL